jgi:dynein heavy chain
MYVPRQLTAPCISSCMRVRSVLLRVCFAACFAPSYPRLASCGLAFASLMGGFGQRYNETHTIMSLVLFDQAVEHVLRVCRVLRRPAGHVLLIGVGGSGKQSLARLAAFMVDYSVVSPKSHPSYSALDLFEELRELFRRAAIKPALPQLLLITDSHVRDDRLLMYVNDLLATGFVSDLYTADELDATFSLLRSEAKAAGVMETREAMVRTCLCGLFGSCLQD